jgi:hypothetical protein
VQALAAEQDTDSIRPPDRVAFADRNFFQADVAAPAPSAPVMAIAASSPQIASTTAALLLVACRLHSCIVSRLSR